MTELYLERTRQTRRAPVEVSFELSGRMRIATLNWFHGGGDGGDGDDGKGMEMERAIDIR